METPLQQNSFGGYSARSVAGRYSRSAKTEYTFSAQSRSLVQVADRMTRRAPGGLRKLNLGGIHAGTGRRERLRYLYLSDEEIGMLHGLARDGLEVIAQDLPTSRPVPLRELG